jgi:hypothetical protein
VADGEAGDYRGPLGIEKQQQSGQAVFRLESVVVQQAPGGGPASLVVHRLGGAVPLLGKKAEIAGDLSGKGQRTKWLASRRWRATSMENRVGQ